jgi:hypothetical protein
LTFQEASSFLDVDTGILFPDSSIDTPWKLNAEAQRRGENEKKERLRLSLVPSEFDAPFF